MMRKRGFRERDSHMDNKKAKGIFGLPPDAEEVFLEAMITGDTSGAIMAQEKRGQAEQIYADRLPLQINTRNVTRDGLETIGFKFGKIIDDIFIEATLPPGWTKKATDHSMWSTILDDKGRERCAVFYKAAFYDRNAHLDVHRRYRAGMYPVTGYGEGYDPNSPDIARVMDRDKVIWESPESLPRNEKPGYDPVRSDKYEAMFQQAKDWLAEHFPDHENPLAYWD